MKGMTISEVQLAICLLIAILCVNVVFPLIHNLYLRISIGLHRRRLYKYIKAQRARIQVLRRLRHDFRIHESMANNQLLPIVRPGMQFISFLDREGNMIDEYGKPVIKH